MMYNSKDIWTRFWHKESCLPILDKNHPGYNLLYGGTNIEPLASMGMSCFLEPCIDSFSEGFSILDYGCGAGILSNFLSMRLEKFRYVGLEPKTKHGVERIGIAKRMLNDERVEFDFISNQKIETLRKQHFDCIVLISVFTHLTIEEIYLILDNLKDFLNSGAKIVFSCFIRDEYKLVKPQHNINNNFYNFSFLTENQLLSYANANNLFLKKECDFLALGSNLHNIYSLSLKG
jgi:2-polyprenyl-3-methyl-5-hydroxy-6-metoxy-1,4-benzoquinol methylase